MIALWMLTVLAIAMSVYMGGRLWIHHCRKVGWLETPRHDGPARHIETKKNTVTGGGVFVVPSFALIVALIYPNPYVLLGVGGIMACAIVGVIDDYHKLTRQSNPDKRGLSVKSKLALQCAISAVVIGVLVTLPGWDSYVYLGGATLFFMHPAIYAVLASIYLVFMINAVNLTDGLDGLASGSALPALTAMVALVSLIAIMPVRRESVVVLGVALSVAYGVFLLVYNRHPAKIFMGDTGSLALGCGLGILGLISGEVLLSLVIYFVFVADGLSSIMQTGYFKLTRRLFGTPKRLFKMAPFHHHFEELGYDERTIVGGFWLASCLFALIGVGVVCVIGSLVK